MTVINFSEIPWDSIRGEYLSGQASYRVLAEKYHLALSTISRCAQKDHWQAEREQIGYRARTEADAMLVQAKSSALGGAAALSEEYLLLVREQLRSSTAEDVRTLLALRQYLQVGFKNLRDACGLPTAAQQVSIDRLALEREKWQSTQEGRKQDPAAPFRILVHLPDGTEDVGFEVDG